MPEVVTSWDEAPAAGKPAVVAEWGDKESAPSLLKRAASWAKENAPAAASDAGNALLRLAGILPPVIAAKGGEQAAGVVEFMTGMIPWAGNIAAGVTGIETGAEAAIKGKPFGPGFYKGVEGAQALLKPAEEILAPQSRTGKQIAEGFGKAVEWGQEHIPGSPQSVAEAGYPGVAAVESGALQVLGIPALMKGAVSAVPLGGSLIAKHLAERSRGVGSVSGAPGLGVPTENQSVAAQLRAIRPETPESPGGPTARPAGGEGEAPAGRPSAAPAPAAFNPTQEWQPIPPDAVLPPGLEIKMNMQTGQNEARLRPPAAAPTPPAKPIKDQIAGTKPPVMSEWGTVTGGEAVDLADYFRKPVEDVRDGALRLLARGDTPMSMAAQAELARRAAGRPAEPRAGVSPAPGQPPDMPAIPAPAGAPLFKPQPGDAPDMPRHGLKGLEVVEVPVDGLQLSAEVPQFKKAANEKGVVQPLGGKFDRIGVAPIQVWQRMNGDLEVISGRHRWDLAQRSGEESMPAQIHREADGFTARQASRLDAELNIRDEQGSIADYANYFRESGITEDAANAAGLLARAKGKSGFSIARDAAEEVYTAHRAGLLSDEAAYEIARAAPGNGSLQAVGLKLVNEGRPISLAVNTMRALSLMPRGEVKPDQGDIFGFDDSLIKEQMEVAKRAAAAQREIREQIAAVSGATKRPEVARKMGVDVKDPKAVQAKIDELRLESERMQNWPMYPDLVEKFGGRPAARAPDVPPEAAPAAVEPAISIDTAATGQPFQARLMRGEGRPDSPYNELVPQEGVLGLGRYTTNNLEFAKYFGPNITEHDIRLENPLVIENDTQWRALTKKAGWEFPNPISMTGDTAKASANIAKLQEMIIADGHDGVIVKVPEREDIGKTMQKVFGESQVIEFVQADTQTQGMFQKRAPYNADQTGLFEEKPTPKAKPAAAPPSEKPGERPAIESKSTPERTQKLGELADSIESIDKSLADLWRRNSEKAPSPYEKIDGLERMAKRMIETNKRKNMQAEPVTDEAEITSDKLVSEWPGTAALPADMRDAVLQRVNAARAELNQRGYRFFGDHTTQPNTGDVPALSIRDNAMRVVHTADIWGARKQRLDSGAKNVKRETVERSWDHLVAELSGEKAPQSIVDVETAGGDARESVSKAEERAIIKEYPPADGIKPKTKDAEFFLPNTVKTAAEDRKLRVIASALRQAERHLAKESEAYEDLRAKGMEAVTNYDIVEQYKGDAAAALDTNLLRKQLAVERLKSVIYALEQARDTTGLFAETKTPAAETKPAENPALELKGETEAERFDREQAAKKTKEKGEAEAKAADEAARAAGVRKEIADRSKGAGFELSATEAVDKKRQAEIDRKQAEDSLSGQNKLFEEGGAKYEASREPAEQGVRENIRGQAPEGQLDLFNQVSVKGSPVKTFEKIVVEAEKVGERKISVDRVEHAGHAAAVFQDLTRSPMEKFQVLGLDENNKPIAFFDMFAGTVTQTSVFPREVWTAVYQTPGVKSVWVAHQHPSGLAEPSRADQVLTKGLQQALTPDIGVELKGHLIITKGETVDIGPGGFDRNRVDVAVGMQPRTIPIMERVITREEGAREVLQSPAAVRGFFRNLDPKETGLLFLDAQNKAVSWWPMSIPEMAKLRTGDVNTGMGGLLKKVGRTNAAAIAYSPEATTPAFDKAVQNVGFALSLADVKMLDAITTEPGTATGGLGPMRSHAELGIPLSSLTDFNIGITPKAMAQGVGAMADLARAAGRRAAETKLGAAAAEWGAAVTEDLQTKITPMAAGTDAARAITKDFANADRLSRWQWTRFDDILKKNFTQEQRAKMWDAAEDENAVRMEKIPEGDRAGRGLDRLTKEERATMDTLQEYGDKLLERARDVGLFRGEGVEYWAPRIVTMVGEDGTFGLPKAKRTGPPAGPGRSPYTSPVGGNITTSASSLKQRKYATVGETEAAAKTKFGEGAQVVRDIRTMPMAMARIERAIAGKELVNAIKEFGKTSGQDLVVDAAKDGYFTLDHPAFKIYRYRPDIKFTEAWDKNMWQSMNAFADSIGVKHDRLLKMGGGTWGKAYMGGNRIETRFGGPETVMTHEIGHQLDYKYGLVEKFFGGDRPKSDFILERQITKAEREGSTGLAEKYRKQMTINREMRDLADLRFEGMETSEYYKKYVRKGTEKMANMVHAYVHAPEKFRAAAPTAYTEFKGFLNQHPELAGLDQIKPSLTLGSGGFVKRPPGEDFDVFPVYVSKEFEGPLKAVMSDIPGKLYSSMMDLKGKTMGVIMYSPLIHNGVEWGRALPLMPGKIITFKAYFDGNVAKNNPEIMGQAIKEGLVPIGHRFFMQDITGIMEDPTLKPGRSWTAKLAGGAVGLVSKPAAESVKRGIDAAGDFWHNTLLWDRIGDLQMGIYSNTKADLIKGGMEPETAGRLASHFANRYAGALPNESMSAMARKVANFAFFSRTFTFGNLGVMKDMMTGLPRDVQSQIIRDAGEVANFAAKGKAQAIAIKAFGTDIAMMYAANSALQSGFDYLKRDKSLDEIEQGYVDRFDRMVKKAQESPSDLLKPFSMLESLTPTSENEPGKEFRVLYDYDQTGTGIYVRLPTGKIGEEFLSWATSPLDILKRKEGTIARPLIQTLTNDRGFGRHVYNPDTPGFKGAARAMGNIAWNMLSQQFPVDSLNAAIDIAKGHSDETDALKVVGPLFGLTFSKGAPGGPEVGEVFTAERQHRAEVSEAMPEIKRLIKHDEMDIAVERMYEAHMTPEEIHATIHFATVPSARLTPRAMKKFFQIAPPEARERMERMREQKQ